MKAADTAGTVELLSAARALLRADDLHLDNRVEKAALRAALLRVLADRP